MSIKKILTRRDFLGSGVLHSFGSIFLPSLATLLRNERALAAGETCSVNGEQMPAFIAIDLQGGASIAGNNIIVRDKNKALLTDYGGLGLDGVPDESNDINTEFGIEMHEDSPMLRGMRSTTTAEVRAKVNGFVICAQSADDTPNNKMATAPGIFKAGCGGSIVPLVGMRKTPSGGNSMTPFGTDVAPTLIENLASAQQLISAGELWTGARAARLEKVLQTIDSLNSTRLKALGQLSLPEQAMAMMQCSYSKAGKMMGGDKPNLNPDADPNLSQTAGGNDLENPNTNTSQPCYGGHWHGHGSTGMDQASKQIGYMVLKGFAGSGTITLPGYDYHDGSGTTGFAADERAGRVIGNMLTMAAALGRKLMLHIYTDGGVDSQNAAVDANAGKCNDNTEREVKRRKWTGDSEARAAAFVLVFDPAGQPTLSSQQMGAYKSDDGGTVDLQPSEHTAISENPEAHATAVIANYLSWQGREQDLFSQVMSNSPIRSGELDKYLFLRKS